MQSNTHASGPVVTAKNVLFYFIPFFSLILLYSSHWQRHHFISRFHMKFFDVAWRKMRSNCVLNERNNKWNKCTTQPYLTSSECLNTDLSVLFRYYYCWRLDTSNIIQHSTSNRYRRLWMTILNFHDIMPDGQFIDNPLI